MKQIPLDAKGLQDALMNARDEIVYIRMRREDIWDVTHSVDGMSHSGEKTGEQRDALDVELTPTINVDRARGFVNLIHNRFVDRFDEERKETSVRRRTNYGPEIVIYPNDEIDLLRDIVDNVNEAIKRDADDPKRANANILRYTAMFHAPFYYEVKDFLPDDVRLRTLQRAVRSLKLAIKRELPPETNASTIRALEFAKEIIGKVAKKAEHYPADMQQQADIFSNLMKAINSRVARDRIGPSEPGELSR